jgi:hypothetical protein
MASFVNDQYQVRLHDISEEGNMVDIMPVNTSEDVYIRGVSEEGTLTLPGDSDYTTLTATLSNIRKWLYNLSSTAKEVRIVSDNKKDESLINIPSTVVTTELSKEIDALSDEVDRYHTELTNADKTHADTKATASTYAHVKLSDEYKTKVNNGAAANAIAPSQNALYDGWKDLEDRKAPNVHNATNKATYGGATSTNYGHVITQDDYTKDSSDTAMVPSQHGMKALYDKTTELVDDAWTGSGGINSKAPKYHADTETTYGVGTTTKYGHLKISDAYNEDTQETSGKSVNGVAASSWAVKRCYDAAISVMTGKLNGHIDEKATSTKFSHVALTDVYTVNSGAANSGYGASSKALYDAYNAAISALTTHSNVKSTASVYGHVALSDTYNSKVDEGDAANALGASQNALFNAYDEIDTRMGTQIRINDIQPTETGVVWLKIDSR